MSALPQEKMGISIKSARSNKFHRLTATIFTPQSALALVGIVLAGTRMLWGQHTASKATQREQSEFGVELVPIQRPVHLSGRALSALRKDERVASCLESAGLRPEQLPADWFIASQIHLDGPHERDLIVLPGGPPDGPPRNDCLVGANTGQFWVLRKIPHGFVPVLSQMALHLEVLRTATNGFRDIKLSAVVGGEVAALDYQFNGHSYEIPGRGQAGGSCLQYEPSVVKLTGTLIRKTFPGRPNYESVRKGDEPETYWLLVLAPAACVDEDKTEPDLNVAQKDVRRIQLVVNKEIYKKHRGLLGKHVVVTGTLYGAHTGHHHTPVLLTVSTLARAK